MLTEYDIYEALGEASMCWDPRPSGVFDSTRATEIGKRLIAKLQDPGEKSKKMESLTQEVILHFRPLTSEEILVLSRGEGKVTESNLSEFMNLELGIPHPDHTIENK